VAPGGDIDHGDFHHDNPPYPPGQMADCCPATTLIAVVREPGAVWLHNAGRHEQHLEARMGIAVTLHADGHCAIAVDHAQTGPRAKLGLEEVVCGPTRHAAACHNIQRSLST
jgi:hypothetical protein